MWKCRPKRLLRQRFTLALLSSLDYIRAMPTIKEHPEFRAWIDGVKDRKVRLTITARIQRLRVGLGDVEPVGEGVSELRIHLGAGWRVYFVRRGEDVVLLLCGGSKRTQDADIKRAKALAAEID